MLRRIRPALAVALCLAPALAVRADMVYFVSKDTGGLYRFDTTGGAIAPLTAENTFPNATALALGPDGNLYVGDATGGGSIRRYATADGAVSTVVTLGGADPAFAGGPVAPAAIAFTPGGEMLVGRNPESQFSGYPAGQVLRITNWNGGSPAVQNQTSGTSLNYQTGLAVAPDGRLFASNTLYDLLAVPPVLVGDVVAFDGSGAYQSVVAADGSATGGLFGPTGLVVSGSLLFTVSTMNGAIYKTDLTDVDTATNTTAFATAGGAYIGPLTRLADGGLLAAYVGGPLGRGNIFRFDTSGSLTATFGGTEYGAIGGVVAVPEPAAGLLAVAGAAAAGLWRLRRPREA